MFLKHEETYQLEEIKRHLAKWKKRLNETVERKIELNYTEERLFKYAEAGRSIVCVCTSLFETVMDKEHADNLLLLTDDQITDFIDTSLIKFKNDQKVEKIWIHDVFVKKEQLESGQPGRGLVMTIRGFIMYYGDELYSHMKPSTDLTPEEILRQSSIYNQ